MAAYFIGQRVDSINYGICYIDWEYAGESPNDDDEKHCVIRDGEEWELVRKSSLKPHRERYEQLTIL